MSPECVFVLENYNDYISGELDPAGVSRVERHMAVCPNCDVFLKRFSAVHNRTVDLLRIPAPDSLRESIADLMEKV